MSKLRLHYLQHVPFEGLGFIEDWAINKAVVSSTKLFKNEHFPSQNDFDWLIVMGGPMNIYEDELYPWLSKEKLFIQETIAQQKVVIGICLGAQLIAEVLGAKVYSNKDKEIGWFPVSFMKEHLPAKMSDVFPEELTVMHWHGDTFTIPDNSIHFSKSKACTNQAFIYNDRVLALQYHLETTAESLGALIDNCGDEVTEGFYIQSAEAMLKKHNLSAINTTMGNLLNYFLKRLPGKVNTNN